MRFTELELIPLIQNSKSKIQNLPSLIPSISREVHSRHLKMPGCVYLAIEM